MFVTTAGRTTEECIEAAKKVAKELEVEYISRNKRSVGDLMEMQGSDCLVLGKERLELYQKDTGQMPFFFHPNSAMFRMKRIQQGDHDPFIEAAGLQKGMSVLDCTLGLASDAIVASFVVGNAGKVTGIESQKYLSYVVGQGLKTWDTGSHFMDEALKRIEVVHTHSLQFLRELPNNSYDVVYFDPMFEESILESDGIKALGHFALYEDLTFEMIREALRVARYRVVLKDHYKSPRFEKFGFNANRRKTSKFHFGFLEKN